MKLQDLVFLIIFLGLIVFNRRQQRELFVGISFLMLSILFFRSRIFFTAERLVWYAAAFFLFLIVKLYWHENRN